MGRLFLHGGADQKDRGLGAILVRVQRICGRDGRNGDKGRKFLIQEGKKGKLYIGESAGAIIVAPNIGYSSEMDHLEKASDLKDYTDLGLIDFHVVPHYKNWEMGKSAEKIIGMYSASLNLKTISDNQAILVNENEVKILNN